MGDDTWRRWGTEQCGSNFAVANSPDPLVLPYPKYANFDPVSYWPATSNLNEQNNAFLHFIGTYRYADNYYATKATSVIRELNAA